MMKMMKASGTGIYLRGCISKNIIQTFKSKFQRIELKACALQLQKEYQQVQVKFQ